MPNWALVSGELDLGPLCRLYSDYSVTTIYEKFHQTLVIGQLADNAKNNGVSNNAHGLLMCEVSFLGLLVKLPIVICFLYVEAIMGTLCTLHLKLIVAFY